MAAAATSGLDPSERGAAIALGNFDGMHAGHRAVIESAREAARRLNVKLGVATFEPPPRRFFQPGAPPFRLMTPRRRAIVLDALGVDMCSLLHFDASMAAMTDRQFAEEVLVAQIGAVSVSVGFDFRFGKNRMGDADGLRGLGKVLGFEVKVVEEVASDGEKVSSSRIREAIERGDMEEARRALGGWWIVDAIVEHGEKRGRSLGFPTANMRLGDIVHPAQGVYAVWARADADNAWRTGVASFGRTPTTGLRDPLLEVAMFDFDGDLYGKRVHTAFARYLRPERKFAGIPELVAAMQQDAAEAQAILAGLQPPGL